MGNSHPQEPSFILDARSIEDWIKVQEQGYCQLWMNKKTNKQVQAYPIPESFVRSQEQLQKYNFRKAHRQNLVVVEAIVTPGNSSFCSEPRTAYALVQNITARLSQFKNSLSFEQALYVLSAAAAGYNTLNSFFGPLQPHSDMICFNELGEVKIWLNQNLALNEPSQSAKPTNPPSDDYNVAQKRTKQGVNKLIRIVEQASVSQFGAPFSEECKKISTYFETANMVSYFCYAYNIQLPSNILVFKNLQNPSVNLQKMLIKQGSQHSFHGNPRSLDSSRVKTVLFRSSHVHQIEAKHQLINPSVSRPMPEQHSIRINAAPRMSQNIAQFAQSPKITFNIRSTLPAQLSQQKVEGVLFGKPIFKTAASNSDFSRIPLVGMRPPEEPKVHIKIEEIRRSVSGGEPKVNGNPLKQVADQQHQFFAVTNSVLPLNQHPEQPKHEKTVIENIQIQTKVEPATSVQKNSGDQNLNRTEQAKNTLSYNTLKQQNLETNTFGDNYLFVNQLLQSQRYSQDDHHENSIKQTSYFNQPQEYQNYHQSNEQEYVDQFENNRNVKIDSKTSAIEDLKQLVYLQDVANYHQYKHQDSNQQHYSQQKKQENEQPEYESQLEENVKDEYEIQNSSYSNIEKYAAPPNHLRYQQSPIIEQLEENFSSPPKDHTEIQEWEARLTKFTQSKHSQQNELEPKTFQLQKLSEKVHVPSVQSKRQVFYKEESKQEPANELANLDEYGIEEYIRKKYNLYATQLSSYQDKRDAPQRISTRERASYLNGPERISYDYGNKNDEPQQTQPISSYKSNRYENKIEPWKTKDYTKNAYQKQNYYPKYQHSYNNRISIQLSQPQIYQNRYPYQQDKFTRKEPEKLQYRASEMAKIDQRYNKYVVNASRAKQNTAVNRSSMSKDVSLIIGVDVEDSKISRFSPKPVIPQLQQSVKRGYNMFGNYMISPAAKNQVTYQKLRNLLWSE